MSETRAHENRDTCAQDTYWGGTEGGVNTTQPVEEMCVSIKSELKQTVAHAFLATRSIGRVCVTVDRLATGVGCSKLKVVLHGAMVGCRCGAVRATHCFGAGHPYTVVLRVNVELPTSTRSSSGRNGFVLLLIRSRSLPCVDAAYVRRSACRCRRDRGQVRR